MSNFLTMKVSSQINYMKTSFCALVLVLVLWILPFLFGKYVDLSFPFIREKDMIKELVGFFEVSRKEKGTMCPILSPNLKGMNYNIHQTLKEVDQSLENLADSVSVMPGGVWQPNVCQARYETVIIVPYRNRSKQLKKFLGYMHPFLQRQQLHYRIIVVEQKDTKAFNRARLLNIGFKEATLLGSPDLCVVFHDVDLIPQNDLNTYACTHQPRHMWSSLDTFRYHLPYRTLAGGAFAILSLHFKQVNGFSNSFNGWGGEDDDFSERLRINGLNFERFDPRIARYVMLSHTKAIPFKERWTNLKRINITDGLSTLKYQILEIKYFPLYTLFSVI